MKRLNYRSHFRLIGLLLLSITSAPDLARGGAAEQTCDLESFRDIAARRHALAAQKGKKSEAGLPSSAVRELEQAERNLNKLGEAPSQNFVRAVDDVPEGLSEELAHLNFRPARNSAVGDTFRALRRAFEPNQDAIPPAAPVRGSVSLKETRAFTAARAKAWVSENKCLSCHTVLPLAFNYRHGGTVDAATAGAMDEVRRYIEGRADNFMNRSAWYGSREGHSSEAVISALMIASEETGRQAPSTLARKVAKNLRQIQEQDGSFRWLDKGREPFESTRGKLFGNAMAAHAFARTNPFILEEAENVAAFKALKGYLRKEAKRSDLNLMDKATLLWADSARSDLVAERILTETQAAKFADEIFAAQEGSGGFSMEKLTGWNKKKPGIAGKPDSLATSYVLNALEDTKAGMPGTPLRAKMDKGLDWLAGQRRADGTFEASSVNFNNDFSHGLMTDFASNMSSSVLAKTGRGQALDGSEILAAARSAPGEGVSARGPPGGALSEREVLRSKALEALEPLRGNRQVTAAELESIERAHNVGVGQVGRDGDLAGLGNYTDAQLREKSRILQNAGFTSEERRALMENEVVGRPRARAAASSVAGPVVPENKFTKTLKIKSDHLATVKRVAKKYGVDNLTDKNWRGAVNTVHDSIASMPRKTALQKGELMAQFGADLDKTVISKLTKDQRKSVNYALGMAVTKLEAFQPEDFTRVSRDSFRFHRSAESAVSFDRYLPYTKRYLKGDTSFVGGGLLSRPDIREMEAHNLFPAYINHDMRHVHWGSGHPRGLATIFASARSQNHDRYVIQGAAFEAVDTVQFSEESDIARYFDQKRNMDIEEGMTYISRATKAELEKIKDESGARENFDSIIPTFRDWKPSTYPSEKVEELGSEVDNMVVDFAKYREDPELKDVLKYSNNPNFGEGNWVATNDEAKNYYGRNSRYSAVSSLYGSSGEQRVTDLRENAMKAMIWAAAKNDASSEAIFRESAQALVNTGQNTESVNSMRKLIEGDAAFLRQNLEGSPRNSPDLIGAALNTEGRKADYRSLLATGNMGAESDAQATEALLSKLEKLDEIDHSTRKDALTIVDRLKKKGDNDLIFALRRSDQGEPALPKEMEGAVLEGKDGKVILQTHENATLPGRLADEGMLAHESAHVESLRLKKSIDSLEAKLGAAKTETEVKAARESVLDASMRSGEFQATGDYSVSRLQHYEKFYAFDEVDAHLTGARKEVALARLFLNKSGGREARLRSSTGLVLATSSLDKAEDLAVASRINLENVKSILKRDPNALQFDPQTGMHFVDISHGPKSMVYRAQLPKGMVGEAAAKRMQEVVDHSLAKLEKSTKESADYIAKETERLSGKLGSGQEEILADLKARKPLDPTQGVSARGPPAADEASRARNSSGFFSNLFGRGSRPAASPVAPEPVVAPVNNNSGLMGSLFGNAGSVRPAGAVPPPLPAGVIGTVPVNRFTELLTPLNPLNFTTVKQAAAKYGAAHLEARDWRGVVNTVHDSIAAMPDKTPVERGELMAQFAEDISKKVIDKLPLEERKSVNYAFGMAVGKLEEFQPEQFQKVSASEFPLQMDAANLVSFDRYLPYTQRYLRNDTSFISGRIIDRQLIREMEAHNLFPAYIAHDMRHVHYGSGHPRAVASIMTAARSQNHDRYVIMGAAYEAVDTIQYSEEAGLAKYFGGTRGMDIEEGMTFISRATKKELDRIKAEAPSGSNFNTIIPEFADWKPKTFPGEQLEKLRTDVHDMVTTFSNYRDDPSLENTLKYSNNPQFGADNWVAVNDEAKNYRGRNDRYSAVSGTVYRNVPVYTKSTLTEASSQVKAAVRYRDAGEQALADARRSYFSGKGSLKELEKVNAQYGHLESAVTGTTEEARRVGYLRQEENYLGRELAKTKAEIGENPSSPDLLRQQKKLEEDYASVSAQLAGETQARFAKIAQDGASAKAARRGAIESLGKSFFSRHQEQFPGRTFEQVAKDPKESALLGKLIAKDSSGERQIAAESRQAVVNVVGDRLAKGGDARAEKMTRDLFDVNGILGKETGESRRTKMISELKKKGWSDEEVQGCVAKGVCAICPLRGSCSSRLATPPVAGPRKEASPLAREVLLQAEAKPAEAGAADQAKAVAELPEPSARSYKSMMDSLKEKEHALAAESQALNAKAAAAPADAGLRAEAQDVMRARAVVGERLTKLRENSKALETARALTGEEEKLNDLAVGKVVKYLQSPGSGSALEKIDARLKGAAIADSVVGEARLEKYLKFKETVGQLDPATRARVLEKISGEAAAGAVPKDLAKTLERSDAVANAAGISDPAFTRAVLRDAKLKPEQQALADAVGATKAGAKSSVERKAVTEVASRKLLAEEKSAGRSLASVAKPEDVGILAKRELASIAGMNESTRNELARSMAVLEPDSAKAAEAVQRMQSLARDPDMFETYRMAYVSAADALAGDKSLSREKAWENGVRKMLEDSGYSKGEIDGESGLLKKTMACLKM